MNSNHTEWAQTHQTHEVPFNSNVIITVAIAIMSTFGITLVIVFVYSNLRRDRIMQAYEDRRRQRIEAFLGDVSEVKTPWQRAVSSMSQEHLEGVLCRLMYTFTWQSSDMQPQSCVKQEKSENDDDRLCIEDFENDDCCAICISSFEDGDEVVQSTVDINNENKINVCVHRFHKTCMTEWLLRSKEPICPCCRRDYLDEARMMEEGLILEDDLKEESNASTTSDRSEDFIVQSGYGDDQVAH